MPPRGSIDEMRDVEIIVKGGSPVFAALATVTTVMLVLTLALQYVELTGIFDYPAGIFF